MHVGDRSHERLVRLDSIKFNYPGYKADIKKAEHYHVKYPDLFYGRLEGMRRKQQVHDGKRDHPDLVLLDNLKHNLEYGEIYIGNSKSMQRQRQNDTHNCTLNDLFSYRTFSDGHEEDVERAEFLHSNSPTNFKDLLFEIDQKVIEHVFLQVN